MFSDRIQAGMLLAKKLSFFNKDRKAIVVAIPNGGITTAHSIAKELGLPLEIELVKKIRHPDEFNKIIGAIGIHGREFNKNSGVTSDFFENDAANHLAHLQNKHDLFLGKKVVHSLTNKTVILVDDGLETGNTISLAIRLIRTQNPRSIVLAIPIAPRIILDHLKNMVDETICLKYSLVNDQLKDHYEQFNKVEDNTVIQLLSE